MQIRLVNVRHKNIAAVYAIKECDEVKLYQGAIGELHMHVHWVGGGYSSTVTCPFSV